MSNGKPKDPSPLDWVPVILVFGLVLIVVLAVGYFLMSRVDARRATGASYGQAAGIIAPQPKMQGEVNGIVGPPLPVPPDAPLEAVVFHDDDGDGNHDGDPLLASFAVSPNGFYKVLFDRTGHTPEDYVVGILGQGKITITDDSQFMCEPHMTTCVNTVHFP